MTEPSGTEARSTPLDGIRGVAIFIVLVHNSAWIAGESTRFLLKLATAITATGWLGVQLFFALSGYLITGILLDTKGSPDYFRSFYIRRSLRIFPLYYAFLLAMLVVALTLGSTAVIGPPPWYYWVYLQNWVSPLAAGYHGLAHLWSLAVEEQFYLAWAPVVWWLSRRGLTRLSVLLILVTPFIRAAIRAAGMPDNAAYEFTIARWDALAVGALIALLVRDDAATRRLARWWGPITVGAAAALALLVAVQHGFHQDGWGTQVLGQSLVAILSGSLIVAATATGPAAPVRVQRALSHPSLVVLGKYSYAMYMLHMPITRLLEPVLGEVVRGTDTPFRLLRLALYIGLVLGLSLLGAIVSWRVLERPFLDLKDRFAPRPQSALSTAPLR